MRINKYAALVTGMSRRAADAAIGEGRILINGQPAQIGQDLQSSDEVTLDGKLLDNKVQKTIIMLNKPVGYVSSREGQGSRTIYELLPPELHSLKPAGRLDKDSSGLLLLTNDGELANQLTHPRYQKQKVYEVEIDRPLKPEDFEKITKKGVNIGDKTLSQFQLEARDMRNELRVKTKSHNSYFIPHYSAWLATLAEGRNRQIRRTFDTLGYTVTKLHRIQLGSYILDNLQAGKWKNTVNMVK